MVGWLCFTSHRQQGHLETAPPFTVPISTNLSEKYHFDSKIMTTFFLDTVTKYIVQTVTGKEFGGGSDANIYITIFGEKGDTGKRFLSKSKEGKDKFEKGKVIVSNGIYILDKLELERK